MAKRFALADLPEIIPIFPLPGALLLPRARLPLNLFEPRYLAMMEDCLRTPERFIGMIQPIDAPERVKGSGMLHTIGCVGRVTSFSETDDGRYIISLSGVSRFRMIGEEDGFTPYRRARVEWDSFERDLGGEEKDLGFNRPGFLALLERYFDAVGISSDWDSLKEADSELLINSLSILCPFDPEEKQALLEAPSLTNRRETLVTLMEFAMRSGGEGTPLQ
ncbi:MAG: LON peptidase substrate-binding domain-containing protein [Pseudomonadota bacterium]